MEDRMAAMITATEVLEEVGLLEELKLAMVYAFLLNDGDAVARLKRRIEKLQKPGGADGGEDEAIVGQPE